jgi:hemoglobin
MPRVSPLVLDADGTTGDGAAIRDDVELRMEDSSVRGNLDRSATREAVAAGAGSMTTVHDSTLSGNSGDALRVSGGSLAMRNAASTLLARVGGRRELDRIVAALYRRVLVDPVLAPAFAGLDTERIQAHQRRFLAQVFGGGEAPASGLLRRVHARLVAEHALGDIHFDAVIAHLAAVLEGHGVAPSLRSDVLRVAAATRDEVLGR